MRLEGSEYLNNDNKSSSGSRNDSNDGNPPNPHRSYHFEDLLCVMGSAGIYIVTEACKSDSSHI